MTHHRILVSFRSILLRRFTAAGLACCLLLSLASASYAKSKESQLSPHYRQWLDRDVYYLITNEERDAFLACETDEERDAIIEQFWAIRNPNPGAPTNEYKEEIYRRINYANQYFGTPGAGNGWKTDRGRAYITLGEPQQKAPYYQAQQTKPMEIWFYQNTNPVLPPYFYLLFYQKDIGDEYRFYSPYMDGPDKLTTFSGTINNRKAAFDAIDKELGRDVARTTLSLIPNEPVDINTAESSLSSDVMLSNLKGLANHPLTKEILRRNRDLLTTVKHRIILEGDYLDVLTSTLRDTSGNTNLHYVVRVLKPEDFTIGQSTGHSEKYYYSAQMSTKVLDAQNKVVLSQDKDLTKYLTDAEYEKMKGKLFGYEGILPLIPGKYKVEFVLTNKLTHTSYRTVRDVVVQTPPNSGLSISDIVPFSSAEQLGAQPANLPFSMAGVKFVPELGQQLDLLPGQDLKLMYQIWAPPSDPRVNAGKKLIVEYGYGRPSMRGDSKTFKEELSCEQFDRNGSLITGTKIETKDLQPGNYRLVITVLDPQTQQKVYATASFQIAQGAQTAQAWDVYDDDAAKEIQQGAPDAQRAQLYLFAGNQVAAQEWLRRALTKDPGNEEARSSLAEIFFNKQDYPGVLALYPDGTIGKATDDRAILYISDSLVKTGQTQKAIAVLEAAMNVKPPTAPLYVALASYYDLEGNGQKAAEMRNKGKALVK